MGGLGLSRTGILLAIGAAIVVGALTYVLGLLWTSVALVAILLVAGILLLLANKTAFGRRIAERVGMRFIRTRMGRKFARSQLRAQARRAGIPTVDAAGREVSDVELQLALVDTPETRRIRNQLRTMNPQQRAQALRMLQAQMDAAQEGGELPPGVTPGAAPRPQKFSGRPQSRPPRAKRKKRR